MPCHNTALYLYWYIRPQRCHDPTALASQEAPGKSGDPRQLWVQNVMKVCALPGCANLLRLRGLMSASAVAAVESDSSASLANIVNIAPSTALLARKHLRCDVCRPWRWCPCLSASRCCRYAGRLTRGGRRRSTRRPRLRTSRCAEGLMRRAWGLVQAKVASNPTRHHRTRSASLRLVRRLRHACCVASDIRFLGGIKHNGLPASTSLGGLRPSVCRT